MALISYANEKVPLLFKWVLILSIETRKITSIYFPPKYLIACWLLWLWQWVILLIYCVTFYYNFPVRLKPTSPPPQTRRRTSWPSRPPPPTWCPPCWSPSSSTSSPAEPSSTTTSPPQRGRMMAQRSLFRQAHFRLIPAGHFYLQIIAPMLNLNNTLAHWMINELISLPSLSENHFMKRFSSLRGGAMP